MMKSIYFLFFMSFAHFQMVAGSKIFKLETTEATLTINSNGTLTVIQKKDQIIQLNTSLSDLWKITLKNSLTGKVFILIPDKNTQPNKIDNIFQFVKNDFSIEGKQLPINTEFTISVKDDAFCFSGHLKSNSKEWIFKELIYPNINGIRLNGGQAKVYWPEGLGMLYDDPINFGSKTLLYPSAMGAAMPWFLVNSSGNSIYIGSHDTLQRVKALNLSYIKSMKVLEASINAPINALEYNIPDIMVKSYNGNWYKGSKFFRNWYDKHFKIASSPKWVTNSSGWLLAILKQQNSEVMWAYEDIDKLCDISDKLGLNTIGLFGWAVGGHDHLYPNYQPDNLMGGREELVRAIERAHKRGKKIIMYANGKIIDASTDYYRYNGIETILIEENKKPDLQFYIKQNNSTPVIFVQACTGSEIWRKTMYDLGLQAKSLGADGILYDQLGVLPPILCFSNNHDHRPGHSDEKYRLQMIREISQKIKETDPNFIVMTEATNDVVIRGIDYFHGWGKGTSLTQNSFPEMFRYTFPELIETQRNPAPLITRSDANFAAVYGLRHEIETRYAGDVKYLLNGNMPTSENYLNVVSPPDFTKMQLLPAEVATRYVHSLIEFENENSIFLRNGKFIDEDGIEVTGKDILAKGFVNEGKMGVIVWNKNETTKGNFVISVPGYKLMKAAEPQNPEVVATSALDPNSIRLLIFKKNNN